MTDLKLSQPNTSQAEGESARMTGMGTSPSRPSSKIIHASYSIRGALTHWTKRDWNRWAKAANRTDGTKNVTGDELKEDFLDRFAEGERYLWIGDGDPCEGWTPQEGCPGHVLVEVDL